MHDRSIVSAAPAVQSWRRFRIEDSASDRVSCVFWLFYLEYRSIRLRARSPSASSIFYLFSTFCVPPASFLYFFVLFDYVFGRRARGSGSEEEDEHNGRKEMRKNMPVQVQRPIRVCALYVCDYMYRRIKNVEGTSVPPVALPCPRRWIHHWWHVSDKGDFLPRSAGILSRYILSSGLPSNRRPQNEASTDIRGWLFSSDIYTPNFAHWVARRLVKGDSTSGLVSWRAPRRSGIERTHSSPSLLLSTTLLRNFIRFVSTITKTRYNTYFCHYKKDLLKI